MNTKAVNCSVQEGEQTSTNLIRKLNFNLLMTLVIRVAGTHFQSWPDFSIIPTAKAHRMLKSTIFTFHEDIPKDLYDIWKSQMSN